MKKTRLRIVIIVSQVLVCQCYSEAVKQVGRFIYIKGTQAFPSRLPIDDVAIA